MTPQNYGRKKSNKKWIIWPLLLIGMGVGGIYLFNKNNSLEKSLVKAEQQIELDSIRDAKNLIGYNLLSVQLDGKNKLIANYSDSLKNSSIFQKELESKKNDLEGKYSSLLKEFNKFKKENGSNALKGAKYDSLMNEFRLLETSYANLEKERENLKKEIDNQKGLEKSINQIKNLNQDEKQEKGKPLEAEYKNFLQNAKFIGPKLSGINGEYITFKDNEPKGMEAFAVYESGRLILLKKLNDASKQSTFYLPSINFKKGKIIIYAKDIDENISKKYSIFVKGKQISTKEKLLE